MTLLLILIAISLILFVTPIRQKLVTGPLFKAFRRQLPTMSDTEREALNAGTVWWDAQLFSGKPQWQKLLELPKPTLSKEEQAFLDNQVNTLCSLANDWQETEHDLDLSTAAWDYIKKERFLGMIIPPEHGGLGFSAVAQSEIITRLSTRSSALAVSVMVPNSLGPGELLLQYGTPAQKQYYLPRLAQGLEIPAFALTSPWAGSDAASIPDSGVICRGQYEGQEVLGLRVSWDKRYITLAPVCTVFGLAFQTYDPDGLVGTEKDLGITCALIPSNFPGVSIGRRHMPLNSVFMNGSIKGQEVFIPLSFVIGGQTMLGQGWRMLMECLSTGRGISLPSSNAGMAQLTSRTVGAYARVREQFNVSIAQFEGIEEPLSRIAGNTYWIDAARLLTAQAIDLGEKPSVISGIVKLHITEAARKIVNDGMDVIGGKGICLGPKNFLGRAYQQIPIGITVEGANILTRSLIIFGQGAIRCHPYVLKEMLAAQETNPGKALKAFDFAFSRHVMFVLCNFVRSVRMGWLPHFSAAGTHPDVRTGVRKINRYSAQLALLSDLAMLSFGGSLKRRESISARLGDVLSHLYLASATLKRFQDEGHPEAQQPLLQYALQHHFVAIESALKGLFNNWPRWGAALRCLLYPFGFRATVTTDAVNRQVAASITKQGDLRHAISRNCYLPPDPSDIKEPVAVLEAAFDAYYSTRPIAEKVRSAFKDGRLQDGPTMHPSSVAKSAQAAAVITVQEAQQLAHAHALRDEVIAVDDFPHDWAKSKFAQLSA